MVEPWRRHDLLRVAPRAWTGRENLRFARWVARGWPVIVRRRAAGDEPGMIPVGWPLPPADGKLRLSAQVAPGDAWERVPALALRAVQEDAPSSWQPVVAAVLALAAQTGVEPRVFGSLLWQRLTGLAYLSESSDLDLLWPVSDADSAARIVHGLARIDSASPVRVDGEILLPDGGGVQWREWLDHPSEVLVKTASSVQLRAVRSLFPAPATG